MPTALPKYQPLFNAFAELISQLRKKDSAFFTTKLRYPGQTEGITLDAAMAALRKSSKDDIGFLQQLLTTVKLLGDCIYSHALNILHKMGKITEEYDAGFQSSPFVILLKDFRNKYSLLQKEPAAEPLALGILNTFTNLTHCFIAFELLNDFYKQQLKKNSEKPASVHAQVSIGHKTQVSDLLRVSLFSREDRKIEEREDQERTTESLLELFGVSLHSGVSRKLDFTELPSTPPRPVA